MSFLSSTLTMPTLQKIPSSSSESTLFKSSPMAAGDSQTCRERASNPQSQHDKLKRSTVDRNVQSTATRVETPKRRRHLVSETRTQKRRRTNVMEDDNNPIAIDPLLLGNQNQKRTRPTDGNGSHRQNESHVTNDNDQDLLSNSQDGM